MKQFVAVILNILFLAGALTTFAQDTNMLSQSDTVEQKKLIDFSVELMNAVELCFNELD
jgi:hypothetical protein